MRIRNYKLGIKEICLGLIILVAFILRFYKLADYPAFNADEAAIGYNAYSLIQTGNDEHGNPWPIHFQSFNDYKPGLYFYLVLPFVKLLGLNEWAVRIPGALLGVATVFIVYLLVLELGRLGRLGLLGNQNQSLASVAALMLAISPWHIHFSRGGWEVNAATFFITAAVLFFIRSIRNPKLVNFEFCILSFALSLYTYHAARIVVPLLGFGLIVIYWSEIKNNFKSFLLAGLVGLVVILPLIKDLSGQAGISRAAGVGLFADPGPLNRVNEQRGEHEYFLSISSVLIHNKVVNYSLAFLENWSEHFHGEFLFLSGDEIQRNKVPEEGEMYPLDFLFLLVGLISIVKRWNKNWALFFLWLVVAPAASALTFQSPHALRAQNMVIPLTIISSYGALNIVDLLLKTKNYYKYLVLGIMFLGVTWQFSRYLHQYYVHMAKEYPFSSQYAVKELVHYVSENQYKYKKVIVTDRYDQPYILFLFYMNYPPQIFQQMHELTPKDRFGFSTVRNFDKYEFRNVSWQEMRDFRNTLLVGASGDFAKDANVTKRIFFPGGQVAFEIVPL